MFSTVSATAVVMTVFEVHHSFQSINWNVRVHRNPFDHRNHRIGGKLYGLRGVVHFCYIGHIWPSSGRVLGGLR
jgi:hypothetical protein